MRFIEGFSFSGYRSFPSTDRADLYPLGRINLIAGQNNAGKSNILRVVRSTFSAQLRNTSNWLDQPHGESKSSHSRSVFYPEEQLLEWIPGHSPVSTEEMSEFLKHLPRWDKAPVGLHWPVQDSRQDAIGELIELAKEHGSSEIAATISAKLHRGDGGDYWEDAYRVLTWLGELRPNLPTAVSISGNRAIATDDASFSLDGSGLKRRLQELKSPTTVNLEQRELFKNFEKFVRTVLEDPDLTVDIAHDLSTIHITQNGRTLPIENVGTGLHELIILAAAATITRESIVCIEEPELHLHPLLQRKLLQYLKETSNQYFIATHSAHMLDSELGSIFHVSHDGNHSAVRYAGKARDRAAVCADLGYRPSDLVQSNVIIWVEGPSDRIYLRTWIDQLAPDTFIEGTHYSIMFYGGSLLKELSPLDAEEVDEFISLRALNRNMLVLIDSDKNNPTEVLNESKQSVISKMTEHPGNGMTWVTAGYTIENYIPEIYLTAAINTAHKSTISRSFTTQNRYENPLKQSRIEIKNPSKVSIAKNVGIVPVKDWPFDLKQRVGEVIELIKRANGIN